MDYAAGSGSGKERVATLDNVLAIDFDTVIPGPVLRSSNLSV